MVALLHVASCLVLTPSALRAQAPTTENARGTLTGCNYRRCELTYVPAFFGGRVEVGVGGISEIGGGLTGGGVVRAVDAVPEAREIATRGQVLQATAHAIRVASIVATAVLWQKSRGTSEPTIARLLVGTLGVTMFSLGPIVPQSMAHDRFHEATDVYNRRLPR